MLTIKLERSKTNIVQFLWCLSEAKKNVNIFGFFKMSPDFDCSGS